MLGTFVATVAQLGERCRGEGGCPASAAGILAAVVVFVFIPCLALVALIQLTSRRGHQFVERWLSTFRKWCELDLALLVALLLDGDIVWMTLGLRRRDVHGHHVDRASDRAGPIDRSRWRHRLSQIAPVGTTGRVPSCNGTRLLVLAS